MQMIARIRMPENGVFLCRLSPTVTLVPGDVCLAELDYGLDFGSVLEVFALDETKDASEKVPAFRVVRKKADADETRLAENAAMSEKAKHAFALSVSREKGNVRLLHVRFSYARERLFIRYSAQIPVDLRRFIGQLQRDFKTYVDLWQVGVRDEAALVGCLGPCGRTSCCCSWQRQFETVNVRMAKAQEMSMNPVSLNGSCGRLKCCLRFEYEQYREAGERLPPNGTVVRCGGEAEAETEGWVVGRDVLRGNLTVRTRDGRFLTVSAATAVVVQAARADNGSEKGDGRHEDSGGEWSES
jgi:cell fate regulator YaaT (PSP1 superfamily)